jgi:hypothetical protein
MGAVVTPRRPLMARPQAPEPTGFQPIEVTIHPNEGFRPIEVTPYAPPAAPVAEITEPTTGKKEF